MSTELESYMHDISVREQKDIKYEAAYQQWNDYIEDDLDTLRVTLERIRDKSVCFETPDGEQYDFSEELEEFIEDLI